jgi:FkbM family methyltransferase
MRGLGSLAYMVNAVLLAAGAEPKPVTRMIAGHLMLMDSRNRHHCWAVFLGVYNDELIAPLLGFLRPGGVALDVGGNIGSVTVPLAIAAKRLGGHVVSVEPLLNNAEMMRENLRLNQVEDVVTIIEAGLSSTPHEAELLLREDFEMGSGVGNASVVEDGLPEHFKRVPIKLETLDRLWPTLGNPRLDVVKVDIEGHEDRFLEGGAKTLATFRPVILMEVSRWFYRRRGLDFDRLIPGLLPSGYRIFSLSLTEIEDLKAWDGSDVLFVPEEKAGAPLTEQMAELTA